MQAPDAKPSGRRRSASGRGRGSGSGRGRGRGSRQGSVAGGEEGGDGGLEPVAKAAAEFEALAGAAGSRDSRGRVRRGRGGGRSSGGQRLQRRAARGPVEIEESEGDEEGGVGGSGGGAAHLPQRRGSGADPQQQDQERKGREETAAAVDAEPSIGSWEDWGDGGGSGMGALAAGAAEPAAAGGGSGSGAADASPLLAGPPSPHPSLPGPASGEEAAGAEAATAGGGRRESAVWRRQPTHALLFPKQTAGIIRWHPRGRLRVLGPPTLAALLGEVAAAAAVAAVEEPAAAVAGEQQKQHPEQRRQGGETEGVGEGLAEAGGMGAAGAAAGPRPEGGVAGVRTPQPAPVQLPLLTDGGLLLPGVGGGATDRCGGSSSSGGGDGPRLLRFDDSAGHRWAFLAALQRPGSQPSSCQPSQGQQLPRLWPHQGCMRSRQRRNQRVLRLRLCLLQQQQLGRSQPGPARLASARGRPRRGCPLGLAMPRCRGWRLGRRGGEAPLPPSPGSSEPR